MPAGVWRGELRLSENRQPTRRPGDCQARDAARVVARSEDSEDNQRTELDCAARAPQPLGHTFLATLPTRRSFASCSACVMVVGYSPEAKPHCGLSASRS